MYELEIDRREELYNIGLDIGIDKICSDLHLSAEDIPDLMLIELHRTVDRLVELLLSAY